MRRFMVLLCLPGRCLIRLNVRRRSQLFNDINAIKSCYVYRLRDNSVYQVIAERPLSEEARKAGVIFDGIVQLGLSSKAEKKPNHPTRLILIKINPHTQRGKRPGGKTGPSFQSKPIGHCYMAWQNIEGRPRKGDSMLQ